MLPAFVITGYLGSGKTTLLINSAKKHFSGKKVAVIVNELGEVGVDGKILKNAYSEVLELPEGCICCSLHAEFERALSEIREKYEPEVLLVETSGAAVPYPTALSLQALGFSVEAVICLVDCANFEKYKEDNTARYQIGNSNVVVLNKVDLVEDKKVDQIEKEVLKIWNLYRLVNSFTKEPLYKDLKIYRTSYGKLPGEVFEGAYTLPELMDIPTHHEHNHKHKVINLLEPLAYEELQKQLNSLSENIIRVKGIVRIKGYPFPIAVNYSFGYLDTGAEVKDYSGPSFLVFIGN